MRFALVVLLCSLGISEAGSFLALKLLGEWPSETFHDRYSAYVADGDWEWHQSFVPSPYFGFQKRKSEKDANNFGFLSDVDYPYRKQPGDFVVGILGGSLASSFAADVINAQLFSALAEKVPALKGKHVVVLNLAIQGGKQPQQFFVASYFLKMLDLVVNIDGMTEILDSNEGYPVDFPGLYHELFGPGMATFPERSAVSVVRAVPYFLAALTERLPLADRSSTLFLIWRAGLRAQTLFEDRVKARMLARRETLKPFPSSGWNPKDPSRVEERAESWRRYTALEWSVAHSEGKKAVFFLQPNQRVPPAKPFTEAERKIALAPTGWSNPLSDAERFEHLRQKARELTRAGIPVYDLSDVFKTTEEPVYIDACCHVNEQGNRLIAARVIEALAAPKAAIWK